MDKADEILAEESKMPEDKDVCLEMVIIQLGVVSICRPLNVACSANWKQPDVCKRLHYLLSFF